MTNDNETTAETTLPATVPAEPVQADTAPEASVDAPASETPPKATRKRKPRAKAPNPLAVAVADVLATKDRADAKAKAKEKAYAKARDKGEQKGRINHVALVQAKVGKRRIVWGGKPLDWPKAAKESGKRAEAILKAAGPKGLTYAEYAGAAGSINRLGYMLRKEAAKLG
jgi:hypothetical protein